MPRATAFDRFVEQFVATLLWSSTDDNGTPLDDTYGTSDVDATPVVESCRDFWDSYRDMWTEGGWDDEQAAHDFCLTRNRHGAGFWDRHFNDESKRIGRELTDASHAYGEVDPYVGDDGNLYIQ